MSEPPEHVTRNRGYWDDLARQYVEAGERAWAREEPEWGIWHVPETEIQIFPEQLADKDAIELGCWLASTLDFIVSGYQELGISDSIR